MEGDFLDLIDEVKALVTPEKVFTYALKVPLVKINRQEFLVKNFSNGESPETIQKMLDTSPFKAGIDRSKRNGTGGGSLYRFSSANFGREMGSKEITEKAAAAAKNRPRSGGAIPTADRTSHHAAG